jgi:DNA-binding transcriptional LysR family regulator
MQNFRDLLRSANGLIVFEAAARHLNFTAAGRELGMSQAAVSLAIRRLEERFGTRLFVRRHRRVELTEPGSRFYTDVSLGLSHIQKSADRLRSPSGGSHVTLSASTAFAALWMVPRLQRFREDLPAIELRIQTSDRDLDLKAEGLPLGIRGGDEDDWPDYCLLPMSPEEIYPVCSPAYVEAFGRPRCAEDLIGHRLIHLEEPHRPAVTWPEWLASAGVSAARTPQGLRINDYVSVIQSVMEGQGIALGWAHLTDRLVEIGALVRVTDHVHRTGKSFNVSWPRDQDVSGNVGAVRDWLARQGAARMSAIAPAQG